MGTLWSDKKDTKEVILPQNFVPEGEEAEENDVDPPPSSSNQPSEAQVETSVQRLREWQKVASAIEKEKEKASSSNEDSTSSSTQVSASGRPKRKATWLPCLLGKATANAYE